MGLFDVRYYVSYTPEAAAEARARPGSFREVAESPPWVIFELPSSSPVEIASHVPTVYETGFRNTLLARISHVFVEDDRDDFFGAAVDWYEDTSNLDYWLVEDGPAGWPSVPRGLEGLRSAPAIASGGGTVSNVVVENDRIAFDTTAVGVPHLVKVSYFPNWKAEGAEGPYRSAPSFMVVVPTTGHVELRFAQGFAERGGMLLTFAGLLFLGGWRWRRRRSPAPGDQHPQPDQSEDGARDAFQEGRPGLAEFLDDGGHLDDPVPGPLGS
jgi:hypothetical protein